MVTKVVDVENVERVVGKAAQSLKPKARTAETSPDYTAARAAVDNLIERISEGEQIDALERDEALRKIVTENGLNLGPLREYFDGELKKVIVPVGSTSIGDKSILAVVPEDPGPVMNPSTLATVLDAIVKVVRARVHCTAEVTHAVSLWIVASWGLFPPADPDAGPDLFPLLGISSPTKRCGKSTLLETIFYLVRRPLTAADVTEAALFRTIDKYHPTLLIDEFDRLIRKIKDLIGLLNSAHRREGGVIRTVEVQVNGRKSFEPVRFSTFGPIVLASIGDAPGTIEDRQIRICLERRQHGQRPRRLRRQILQQIRDTTIPNLMAHADAIGAAMARACPTPRSRRS